MSGITLLFPAIFPWFNRHEMRLENKTRHVLDHVSGHVVCLRRCGDRGRLCFLLTTLLKIHLSCWMMMMICL